VQGRLDAKVCKSLMERGGGYDIQVLELLRPAGSYALSQAGDSMQVTSLVTSHSMCTASLVSAELA